MKEADEIVVLITVGTEEEAQRIARALLEQRKAACVNIIPGVSSLFWWKGELDSAQESLLVVKTKKSVLNEVTRLVKEIHSYDIPEVIAVPIVGGNQDYLEWIGEEVK